MRIPVSRVLVGTAVTATALLTAVGTAGATTVKAPTHLVIAGSAAHLTAGQTDVITGALTTNGKPLAKKAVVLVKFYNHSWHSAGAKVTNGDGDVTFYRRPRHSTSYKLIFWGNAKYARSASGTLVVTVRPAVKIKTALSIAGSAHLTAGQTDVITGALTANGKPLAKKAVILARWRHRRWIPVAARATSKTGAVKFVRRPWHTTKFRLEYFGNARFTRTHSKVLSVTVVKIPTALMASASAAAIKAGQRDTISGTLTRGTKPLAKRIVWLYRVVTGKRPYRLQAHLTNAKGKVSFRVKPRATTSYELVYFGNRVLAGSVSGPVTVTVTR